ncbi:PHD finger protein 20-like protein 1 [Paramormyrops kingsleyae]|uniref:PHD finger protein 20-like protein 1 n=1 Tax=Paramormyrops kingsleyae TaxID=1676925 RepID=A0A3B3QF56_9TELE|nr:PHD finger protein 20-like protein 1 [Paramormyrops kingsleyae]XP_023669403.1 PHD finger protein 20-like protein 1 [Paramormyrops kingsleyae]XP_023669409.1 PHD finger protein 20-like protein 1 [Paramormyrops kingsleyae]
MNKKPPVRPGITFEVGARVEAQDYLQKWYPSRIEKIDYDEGKMLVHFDRWSHRYDEWIFWDSERLRPLEKPPLPKVAQKDEAEIPESLSEIRPPRLGELPGRSENTEDQTELHQKQDLRDGEEVLARWTDCRYYPAKIESVNTDGTYTVQFYDGVIRCVKRLHIKSMPEDAKGQDWIALVKAASDAVKSKGTCRPRTSANSNRTKEMRSVLRSDSEAEEAPEDEELDLEKPVCLESLIMEGEACPSPKELEMVKKRKTRQRKPVNARKGHYKKGITVSQSTSEEVTEEQADEVRASEEPLHASFEGTQRAVMVGESVPSPPAPRAAPPAQNTPKPQNVELKLDSSGNEGLGRLSADGEDAPAGSPGLGPAEEAHAEGAVSTIPSTPRTAEHRRRSQRLAPFLPAITFDPVATSPSPLDAQDTSTVEKSESSPDEPVVESPAPAPPPPPQQPSLSVPDRQPDGDASSCGAAEEKPAPLAADAGLKVPSRNKQNKHTREPIINLKKSEGCTSPKELLIDLDHNKFKCKIPECGKAFRKAKLLDYHLKYYHNTDKEAELEAGSPPGPGRSRTASTSLPATSPFEPLVCKRHRTISSSSSLSPQGCALEFEPLDGYPKPPKFSKNLNSVLSLSTGMPDILLDFPRKGKHLDCLHGYDPKKVIEKDKTLRPGLIKTEKKNKFEEKTQPIGKKKEKDKDRKDKKDKFPFRVKQKKKKKKKKKSKQQHSYVDFEDLAFVRRCSSPLKHCSSSFSLPAGPTSRLPKAILSVDLTGEDLSDMDSLEDSTTESALLSGDEYRAEDSADLDSLAMEPFQEEEDYPSDIVRCVCEMDEENGFMIQCEECLCWQHSVCMGLLEDSIPDQYICYICRDPPGQRWSAKYLRDKDWMTKGHMYGLSFLTENYSHSNAEKIVSTHRLLSDVYSVKEVLHGLHLKMDILQNTHDPNLHLWAQSWVDADEKHLACSLRDCMHFQEHSPDDANQDPHVDTYIASEHSYQKPSGPGLDPWPAVREDGAWLGPAPIKEEEERTAISVSGFLNASGPEVSEQERNCLEWQLNLLTHIEDMQSQVAGRMDLIEKELDVLESWLDFSGELEPPDPLARLPQLKRRIKQLLTDLSKVQQISSLCSA